MRTRATASISVRDVLRMLDNQERGPDARKHLRVVMAIDGDQVISIPVCSDRGEDRRACVIEPGEIHARLQPNRSFASYAEASTRSLSELVRSYSKLSTGGVRCPTETFERIKAGIVADPLSRPWLIKRFHDVRRPPRVLAG